jgi:hypothetical protein
MTTSSAGTAAMLRISTVYSSTEPGSAAPPPTTPTRLVIASCCASPTTTSVGWAPLLGLPSPSVSSFGSSSVATTAWLRMMVPDGTPSLTRTSNRTTAVPPGERVPLPVAGNGGVRSSELTSMPAISGEMPPSGWPTPSSLRCRVFAR